MEIPGSSHGAHHKAGSGGGERNAGAMQSSEAFSKELKRKKKLLHEQKKVEEKGSVSESTLSKEKQAIENGKFMKEDDLYEPIPQHIRRLKKLVGYFLKSKDS
ncbi:MAG: hypothetical protein HRT90_00900 [Candidatus Margulisbacteria bacterium]|nr:hypothetical protein [Candidatus Margulisiibacteriota bacterium]